MKILIVGGSGLIGTAVAEKLRSSHEVITAGFSNGDVQVDIRNIDSIDAMYKQVGSFDALITATGKYLIEPLSEMSAEKYGVGIQDKLMGNVNLVLRALPYLNANGSITLTTGILNRQPIPHGSSAAMVNSAIEGFVKGSAVDLQNGIRINAISPTVIVEALEKYGDRFDGYEPVPLSNVTQVFADVIANDITGQIITV